MNKEGMNDRFELVPKLASTVGTVQSGANRVLKSIVADTLALATQSIHPSVPERTSSLGRPPMSAEARQRANQELEAAISRAALRRNLPPRPSAPDPLDAVGRTAAAPAVERLAATPQRGEIFNAPVLPLAEKLQALAELRASALACQKCPHLVASRSNVVFGVGNPEATLMFVGEAPGADEDRLGEPFVGAAGELLTKIIKAMGFTRDTVYIANILKCRPDTPGQSFGNRKPTPDEIATCLPYLLTQIELIRPRVLVTLGVTATHGLLGLTEGITRLRGHWQTFRGIPVMPTYHPSYLLHKPDLSEKRKIWEDMLQVMEKLAVPISDKQRGLFRKQTFKPSGDAHNEK